MVTRELRGKTSTYRLKHHSAETKSSSTWIIWSSGPTALNSTLQLFRLADHGDPVSAYFAPLVRYFSIDMTNSLSKNGIVRSQAMSLSCSALLRLTCGYDLFVLDRRWS